MRKLALMAAVACLVFGYAMNANAANPVWSGTVQSEHYVGFTTATTNGNAHGQVGMNALCQAQYGVTAHICSVDQYFSSASAGSFVQEKWLQPSVSNCISSASSPSGVLCEVPTISNGAFIDPTEWVRYCEGWVSDSSTDFGAAAEAGAVTYAHLSNTTTCNTRLPVACCAP
jgi:hypothetical protein